MIKQDDLRHRDERANTHSPTQRQHAGTPTGQTGTGSPGTSADRPRGQSQHTIVSVLQGVGLALLLGAVRVIEFLSIPVSMIGIGTVLVVLGGYMTASAAMNFILTAMMGVPAAVIGLLLLIGAREGRLAVPGLLVTIAGVGIALYGAFMMVISAPIPVLMTLSGAAVLFFAVRVGLDHSSFTSRRVQIVP